jgi:hypothetical protein
MTFPTRTDLEFFQSKHLQNWTTRIATKSPSPLFTPVQHAIIDDVVNAHAGIRPTSGECAAHNLLVLVRSHLRRRANLVEELQKLAVQPGCAINPEKRAAFARKWARRLSA